MAAAGNSAASRFPQIGLLSPITRAFVIRRNIDMAPTPQPWMHYWKLAHSALLFNCQDGTLHVLEFTKTSPGTSQALLYPVELATLESNATKMVERIRLQPGVSHVPANGKTYEWTKQLNGCTVQPGWTPSLAHVLMAVLTKGKYDLLTQEQCHTAQEKTLQKMQEKSPPK